MKLSTLIHYLSNLDKHTPDDTPVVVSKTIGHSLHEVQHNDIQFPLLTQELGNRYHAVLTAFDQYLGTLDQVKREVQAVIETLEPRYFRDSYSLYEDELRSDRPDHILARSPVLTSEAIAYLGGRIRRFGDWRYPGMIVRPGDESWVEDLVACDPLYIVDTNQDLMEPIKKRFNPIYVNRLRFYVIQESTRGNMFYKLPQSQIGYCLIYNFFNYKPMEMINHYLEEIFRLIKPGGTVSFTFNNCDLPGGVELFERRFMCYTPGKLLLAMCERLGYEIQHTYQIDSASTWVELKKPGELTSLRGGQTLAKVVPKIVAKSK